MSWRSAVSRADVVRELDRRLIEEQGVPSVALMESAGRGVADALAAFAAEQALDRPTTLVLCGPGNNGGDGYVAARHLADRGWPVRAKAVFAPASPQCVLYHGVAARLDLLGDFDSPELVVDAVYGIGQRAPLSLPPVQKGAAKWVALDVPTGVNADTGERIADFPSPNLVICVGRRKTGLFASPCPQTLVPIGLEMVSTSAPEAWFVESKPWIPSVPASANKWDRGHVGVRAGSNAFPGAAVLACVGALRGGAGLVTLFAPRAIWGRLEGLPAEVMVAEPGSESKADVLVVGPGLGPDRTDEISRLWQDYPRAAVFDADGLRAVAGPSAWPRLVTPHAGEAARLLDTEWRALEADRFATARRLATFGVAIYKGVNPIIAGRELHVVAGGHAVLGTGGTGDVLAGLCGALLANARADGPDVERVALAAVWLQQAAAARCPVGTLPSEVAALIPGLR